LAQRLVPILLIQEKPFAKFAIMQSWRNTVGLKGITASKSTQTRQKLPDVIQSFKLQRPDLKVAG